MKIVDNVGEVEITVGQLTNHITISRPTNYSKPDSNTIELSFEQWKQLRDKTDKMIGMLNNLNDLPTE